MVFNGYRRSVHSHLETDCSRKRNIRRKRFNWSWSRRFQRISFDDSHFHKSPRLYTTNVALYVKSVSEILTSTTQDSENNLLDMCTKSLFEKSVQWQCSHIYKKVYGSYWAASSPFCGLFTRPYPIELLSISITSILPG